MYLEAVTICVNYGDFLAQTLPRNKYLFNNYVIVTDTKDHFTKKICDTYNVRCIRTDVFYENGEGFNKGEGINAGLDQLKKTDWVLHLDADICLLPDYKNTLKKKNLNPRKLYGLDRLMCNSYEDWLEIIANPISIFNGITNQYNLGGRFIDREQGYLPLGYHQLWNPIKGKSIYYPSNFTSADKSDIEFAKKWEKNDRELIPETFGVHLDSGNNKQSGINWIGRKTPLFGPVKIDSNQNTEYYE